MSQTYTLEWLWVLINEIFHCSDLVQRNDRLLLYSPLSWVTAIWTTGQILRTGAQKIICEYNEDKNLEILDKYKVNEATSLPKRLQKSTLDELHPRDVPSSRKTMNSFKLLKF